jgi:NAD(P)-dependent dehydrogenase (short-subunit alcohol dehydrogenase family)
MMSASATRVGAVSVGRRATTTRRRSRASTVARASTGSTPVVVVTGANTGLGLETAKAAVRDGNVVVMAVRDVSRGERARTQILETYPDARVEVEACDLADFASVRAFARGFAERHARLDVLVNNSGVMALPERTVTVDGHEKQMQVNHSGHFLLTSLLLETMMRTKRDDGAKKRVVNLSSVAHNLGAWNFHDFDSEEGLWGYPLLGWVTYGRTKMANILFTFELDRRLKAAGVDDVSVNAVHPGVVDTELNRSLTLDFYPQMKRMGRLITPEQGARGQIALAFDPKYEDVSGAYVAEQSDAGKPGVHEIAKANEFAYNREAWARLWKDTVKITGAEWTV